MPTCTGVNVANDVWFSFTTSDSIAIEIDNIKLSNIGTQLFSGTCGSLTALSCQTTNNIIIVPNALSNQTFYLRLFGLSNNAESYFIKAYRKEPTQKNTLFSNNCLFTPQNNNPGFEGYDACPTDFVPSATQGSTLIPGWSFPTKGTSDYLNSCSNFNSNVEVPGNSCFGKQSPRSGNGYVGLFCFATSNYREYIQGNMQTPLVLGKRYVISYYVNLAEVSKVAINKLGIYFSTAQVVENTTSNLLFTPQLVSPTSLFFSDKKEWVNVSHIFTADQAHQFFTIGNFANNANTTTLATINDTLIVNQSAGCVISNNSYINIDDVTISEINEVAVTSLCNTVLPLTLTDFNVTKEAENALLFWKTIYEINTKHFEIERSENGINFIKIGIVNAGLITGNSVKNYTFSDRYPLIGINYYRLKMVEADGKFTYSGIRRLLFDKAQAIAIYPNPVKDIVTISGLQQKGTLSLLSAEGKILYQQMVSTQATTINMSGYTKGLYVLQYINNNEVVNKTITKQ